MPKRSESPFRIIKGDVVGKVVSGGSPGSTFLVFRGQRTPGGKPIWGSIGGFGVGGASSPPGETFRGLGGRKEVPPQGRRLGPHKFFYPAGVWGPETRGVIIPREREEGGFPPHDFLGTTKGGRGRFFNLLISGRSRGIGDEKGACINKITTPGGIYMNRPPL